MKKKKKKKRPAKRRTRRYKGRIRGRKRITPISTRRKKPLQSRRRRKRIPRKSPRSRIRKSKPKKLEIRKYLVRLKYDAKTRGKSKTLEIRVLTRNEEIKTKSEIFHAIKQAALGFNSPKTSIRVIWWIPPRPRRTGNEPANAFTGIILGGEIIPPGIRRGTYKP